MVGDHSLASALAFDNANAAACELVLDWLRKELNAAQAVSLDAWEFATELQALRSAGIADHIVRSLEAQGHIEHRLETSLPEDIRRSFRPANNLRLQDNSCFVLAERERAATMAGTPVELGEFPSSSEPIHLVDCQSGLTPSWQQ